MKDRSEKGFALKSRLKRHRRRALSNLNLCLQALRVEGAPPLEADMILFHFPRDFCMKLI